MRSKLELGLKFENANSGAVIIQLIITDQTGEVSDQYQWEHVLRPIGMTESFFSEPPPLDLLCTLASGFNMGGLPVEGKFRIILEMAAGDLWTTLTDLAKFVIETQLAYDGKSSKVLNQKMTRSILTV